MQEHIANGAASNEKVNEVQPFSLQFFFLSSSFLRNHTLDKIQVGVFCEKE